MLGGHLLRQYEPAPPLPAPSADEAPDWLLVMRSLTGTVETPGDADNPKILAMRDTIADTYPDMAWYCDLYVHDSTPWCGLTAAYCMTMAGIRPPFQDQPAPDTDRWMWALAWADDPEFGTVLDAPRLGCVVVMERSGGGHVTLYERTEGSNYVCRGGNQSDAVNESSYPISSVVALVWPRAGGPIPPAERRQLSEGMSGADVAEVQRILGLPADGDFGPVTEAGVQGFQRATGTQADGVVGPDTWVSLDELDVRMKDGSNHLSDDLIEQIATLAAGSPLSEFNWPGRGVAPIGYTTGMALAFGLAVQALDANIATATVMAQADRDDDDHDALSWYRDEFAKVGMDNSQDGVDTLRHLFVLLIGLGMRESSGNHWCGRDMSATNVESDTAEAGLFQTSWNISNCSSEIPKLLSFFWNDPNGFNEQFDEGVEPSKDDLDNYGSGDGARYQWLAKYCPAFAAYVTAVGTRYLRQHWGPINRKEVTLVTQADDLLAAVQQLILDGDIPPPRPPRPDDEAEVDITIETEGDVRVLVNGQVMP